MVLKKENHKQQEKQKTSITKKINSKQYITLQAKNNDFAPQSEANFTLDTSSARKLGTQEVWYPL